MWSKVALYVLSGGDGTEEAERLEHHASQGGRQFEVVGRFVDQAGASSRPNLRAMLAEAKAGRIDCVVAASLHDLTLPALEELIDYAGGSRSGFRWLVLERSEPFDFGREDLRLAIRLFLSTWLREEFLLRAGQAPA